MMILITHIHTSSLACPSELESSIPLDILLLTSHTAPAAPLSCLLRLSQGPSLSRMQFSQNTVFCLSLLLKSSPLTHPPHMNVYVYKKQGCSFPAPPAPGGNTSTAFVPLTLSRLAP